MANVHYLGPLNHSLHYCNGVALLSVKGGAGRFTVRGTPLHSGSDRWCQICFDDRPLSRPFIEGCSSYAGLLSRGYGEGINHDPQVRMARERVNAPYTGLADAIQSYAPLLGLFKSGVYALGDFDLFPVINFSKTPEMRPYDRFYFWDNPHGRGSLRELQYSSYDSCGRCFYHYHSPLHLAASQSAQHFDRERAEYYRGRLTEDGERFPRAFALYLNGGMALLLDGHHKAAAAAAEGRMVKTLVLFPLDTPLKTADELYRNKTRLYLTNHYRLVLADGQDREWGTVQSAENTAPDSTELLPPDDYPEWGEIPGEYLARIHDYPSEEEIRLGTYMRTNQVRETYEKFLAQCEDFFKGDRSFNAVYGTPELADILLTYKAFFPDSKWLSAEEIEKIKRLTRDLR